jgi:hypothetical protein
MLQGVVTNGSGVVTYKWEFENQNGDVIQVSSEQNYTPTETGIYYFSAIINQCTAKSQGRLFVTATKIEIVNPVTVITDERWRYELFTATSGSDNGFNNTSKSVTITRGLLPNVSGLTDEQINKRISVFYNQNKLSHKNPTTFISEFSITGNVLTIHKNLTQWDVLSIMFLEDLQ